MNINFENVNHSNIEIYVFDFKGTLVKRTYTKESLIRINTSSFSQGTYFYKIVNAGQRKMSTGKFIKE